MDIKLKLISQYIIYIITENHSKLLNMFTENAKFVTNNGKIYQGKDELTNYFITPLRIIPQTSEPKFENNEYSINLYFLAGWKVIKVIFEFEGNLISKIVLKNIGWI